MATINLFGASGHAKVIMDIIKSNGDDVSILYDDDPQLKLVHNKQVLKASECVVAGPLIVSIGANNMRKSVVSRYNLPYATACHNQAIISPSVQIGEGTVVMQGAIVQADVRIGKHCIINTGASVDHECQISDFVHISPHATLCGNVHVGEGTWVGAGSVVIPGVKIGKWCTIGAGSIVLKDIPDGVTAYGNPCKIKSTNMLIINNQQLTGGGKLLTLNNLAA